MVGYDEYVRYVEVFRDDDWALSKNAQCDLLSSVFIPKMDDLAQLVGTAFASEVKLKVVSMHELC